MSATHVEYLIIGAGPAGLQLAYFLEMAGRSYRVLEAGPSAGTFFRRYPRHGKLISINKVYTGYEDPEINLRWDWNSLLSHDATLRLPAFSQDYFPDTAALTDYCEAYAERFELKIAYNSTVTCVKKAADKFVVSDQNEALYEADRLIVATGLSQPYVPSIPGIDLAENYTQVSVEPDDFINQRVLIIGKGNSGFETADNLISAASLIHVASPSSVKMAWQSKYVGHLRAVNNNFLDTYQLKSQNGMLDAEIVSIERVGDEYKVAFSYAHAHGEQEVLSYDRVIVCTGFQFDGSIFDASCQPLLTINDRFPAQTSEWEAVNVPGLYFAGVLMHMRDFKKKQSGFIHGFRHNIQALHQILECKYHQQLWPSDRLAATPQAITQAILDRANSSAGLWQQTGFLCDVVAIDEATKTAQYYRDLSRDYVESSEFSQSAHYYVVTLEFGESVADVLDPFAINRVHKDDANNAEASEFIHPIIRRYAGSFLVDELHIIEDLEADWSEPVHIEPLEAFVQTQLSGEVSPSLISEISALKRSEPPACEPTERPAVAAGRKRLGDHLVEAGLVNDVQLRYALSEQATVPLKLGEILVRHGWLTEQTVEFFVDRLCLAPTAV